MAMMMPMTSGILFKFSSMIFYFNPRPVFSFIHTL